MVRPSTLQRKNKHVNIESNFIFAGNVFSLDQHLPTENTNIRIRIDATAYHSWLLSPVGWPLNSINGHILIYSPLRVASWHHAEMAARMLVAAAGPNVEDQQAVGKSILILAVDDPGNYFSNKVCNLNVLNRTYAIYLELSSPLDSGE